MTDTESKLLLRLYFIPSPLRLNWQSPSTLARSILQSKLLMVPRFMGHVNIELLAEHEHILTGMVAARLNGVELLLKKGMGLGILYHSFEGRLETKEELTPELQGYMQSGNEKISFMQMELSHEQYVKIKEYLKRYEQEKIYQSYGLAHSPLFGEGAGCSAFAASVLQVAGLMTKELQQAWTQRKLIPKTLIGPPYQPKKVNFLGLLAGKSWAKEEDYQNDQAYELYFWDPDKMHAWAQSQTQTLELFHTKGVHYIHHENSETNISIDTSSLTYTDYSLLKTNAYRFKS